jgi:hypothetical protein
MSDIKVPTIPKGLDLTQEQIDAISGGECSLQSIAEITAQLKQSYENLVDFTSYVIERVATATQ